MITKELERFYTILPQEYQDSWEQLFSDTINNQRPPMVCFAGRRDLGKTSLINMLLEKEFLPEGDASLNVPVHFTYGEHFQLRLVDTDGTSHVVEQDEFKAFLKQPPSTCKYLSVTASHDWLHNIELVDPPHEPDVLERYLDMADGIVYLIGSDGLDDQDMSLIQKALAVGRHVWIAVGMWDEVEDAAGQERKGSPDIQAWEQQIKTATGQEISVMPVSRKGTGKFALITFFRNMVQHCNGIRKHRLHAAGIPLLFSYFENLQEEKDAEIRKLEQQKEDIEGRFNNSNKIIKKQNALIPKLEQQNEDLESRSSNLNTTIAARDAKIRELEQQQIAKKSKIAAKFLYFFIGAAAAAAFMFFILPLLSYN